jgi:quercetin dioxygenase-like cupin family protein
MPVIRATEGTEHQIHGVTFTGYANSGTGSAELCAWNCRVPAGQSGVEHRISGEEVFLVLSGAPRISLDGEATDLAPGDVAVAPAGCLLRLDNPGSQHSDIWVTARAGLKAHLPDGTEMAPPWAR